MAIMYPRRLNAADVKSDAERRIFRVLERDLSDEWSV